MWYISMRVLRRSSGEANSSRLLTSRMPARVRRNGGDKAEWRFAVFFFDGMSFTFYRKIKKNKPVVNKYDDTFFKQFLELTLNNVKRLKKQELSRKLGKRIVLLREKKGWSQAELARVCLKDRQSIERLERGTTNPTAYTLYEVAAALEITLAELLKI